MNASRAVRLQHVLLGFRLWVQGSEYSLYMNASRAVRLQHGVLAFRV